MNPPLSYIEISAKNLIHNIRSFRSILSSQTKIATVIKANAYGHGQNEIATIIEPYVDYFQVDDIEELRMLRQVSQKETLVLGYVLKNDLEEAATELNGTLVIYDIERLELLNEIGKRHNKKPKVHIKIDAHLGRQGLMLEDVEDFFEKAKNCEHISIEGIYSHFANIEDTSDFSHAQKQIDSFENAKKIAEKYGFTNLLTHQSATSGILSYEKDTNANIIVRLGVGLYGMWPSEELQKKYKDRIELRPVMRWISHIAQVKNLPENHSVGYGLTHITTKPTTVAIIPQGYSDGYDRGFSNNSEVLIQGSHCKVLGRVSMNMIVADMSHLKNVQPEDEVILLGKQGDEEITAEELAKKLDTINYEITTRVSPLLLRIIKED